VFFLVAILVLLVLSSPWDFIGFVVCLVLGFGELFLWNRTVRKKRVAAGAETLIGSKAKVLAPCRPDGQVQIGGEIWEARCAAGADAGETVRIVGRRGLALVVERV
jgi:membrane protein implicated in regulation of membrane protease activity